MDYHKREKVRDIIDHIVKFLSVVEEDMGIRIGSDFLYKVFDSKVDDTELEDLLDSHNAMVNRQEDKDVPEEKISIMDSFIDRVYFYKMTYMYSKLWEEGYVVPCGVDELGEIRYEESEKTKKDYTKYKAFYDRLCDE